MTDASPPTGGYGRAETLKRRLVTIPTVIVAVIAMTLTAPLWVPIALIVDAVTGRWRFPIVRLLAYGLCYAWLELIGVSWMAGLWLTGRKNDHEAHYRLMGWWAGSNMTAIGRIMGFEMVLEGADEIGDGNAIVMTRHASLADSLLSAWAVCTTCGVQPRYVLKKELLADPCLDVAGGRLPNHFLDRDADDATAELAAVETLAGTIGEGSAAVIFPEGTRSNPSKRARALEKIGARDPERAERMAALEYLLPPRPGGSAALVRGAPDADIVLAWHTGFDGLDTFGGMIRKLAKPLPPVRFVARRVRRTDVPDEAGFERWLDDEWLRLDEQVAAALTDST